MSDKKDALLIAGSRMVALGSESLAESLWLRANDAVPSVPEALRSVVQKAFRAGYLLALADCIDIVNVEPLP